MKFFVVGGAVRDVLLGKTPKDIDYVVVGATAQQLIDLGYVQVGADFPVFLDTRENEVALARTERKTGVGYTGFAVDANESITLEEDLKRRDLTINAMAVNEDDWEDFLKSKDVKYVIDPYNGITDLHDGILRHVSDAFADDPLRVLRVARFVSRYDFKIDDSTQDLMRQLVNAGELQFLTTERILIEVEKTLTEKYSHLFFTTLRDVGALPVVFPDFNHIQLVNIAHDLQVYKLFNITVNDSLVLLLKSVNEPVSDVCSRLHISNHVRDMAQKYNTIMSFLILADMSTFDIHDSIINLLYSVKAFDTPSNITDVLKLVFYSFPKAGSNVYKLYQCFNIASKITFASLSEHERTTLIGKDIGEAIKKRRITAISSVL